MHQGRDDMRIDAIPSNAGPRTRFSVRLAESKADILAAQRLRWRVFAEEQGAQLASPVAGFDIDAFDEQCEHLIVRDLVENEVIGTYRLLTADAADRIGRYYSEGEIDLSHLKGRGERLLEIGRSCVHPAYRSGVVISLLWSGVAAYLLKSRHSALIGCASISLTGNDRAGTALAHQLFSRHASDPGMRVTPKRPLRPDCSGAQADIAVPPLIKGYIRSGAVICGEPCWDPDFNTADLLIYLGIAQADARYARRFLSEGSKVPT